MKKVGLLSIAILFSFCFLFFSGCADSKKATNYYLNPNGQLIVEYNNDTSDNLGDWNSAIINSIGSVGISNNGYYIINGINTNIKVIYQYVVISEDGYYIINGIKTNIEATSVYNVTFNSGFSANIESQLIKDGYKVKKPNLTRTGYTLEGWYCNNEEWRFNSDVVSNDMTLSAKWNAKTYSIIFDEDGGNDIENISVTYDSTYVLPSTTKELYTFSGWMLNNEIISNSGTWKNDENNVITLKAKWVRTSHNVIFDSNGGSNIQKLTVNSFSQINSLPNPEWNDHTFLGWMLNNEIIELPLQMNDSDIYLLAITRS